PYEEAGTWGAAAPVGTPAGGEAEAWTGAAPAGTTADGEAGVWAAAADAPPAASGEPSTALASANAGGAVLDPAALELVERLEAAARRLREHGTAGLAVDLLNGDRFDAMLAGILTGFLAARRG
ncbi:MAG: hypothetical protein IRZ00_17370, partial [Gemmatimonadetes bacterium]|nr:hypothetical protein [Gemmatimonadota bacterium]